MAPVWHGTSAYASSVFAPPTTNKISAMGAMVPAFFSMTVYAVHQSFSRFNTTELGRLHSAQLSLVVWELALTCNGSPPFTICATLARILLSLVVAGLPCCFRAGGNTGSDAINFTYHNFRSPIWRYNYRNRNSRNARSAFNMRNPTA